MVDENIPMRAVPISDLDLQLMMTDPVWGKDIPKGLKEKLTEQLKTRKVYQGEDGKYYYGEVLTDNDLWELLGMYTRDLRLGNLSYQEIIYCQYVIDWSRDCLAEGFYKAFLAGLSRAVTLIELSQSKGGFLRKLFNTVRTQQFSYSDKDEKRGLFGQKKKGNLEV